MFRGCFLDVLGVFSGCFGDFFWMLSRYCLGVVGSFSGYVLDVLDPIV